MWQQDIATADHGAQAAQHFTPLTAAACWRTHARCTATRGMSDRCKQARHSHKVSDFELLHDLHESPGILGMPCTCNQAATSCTAELLTLALAIQGSVRCMIHGAVSQMLWSFGTCPQLPVLYAGSSMDAVSSQTKGSAREAHQISLVI